MYVILQRSVSGALLIVENVHKQESSIDLIVKVIRQHLFKDYQEATLLVPFADGHVVSYLNEHTNILDTDYLPDGTKLRLEIAPEDLQRFQKYLLTE